MMSNFEKLEFKRHEPLEVSFVDAFLKLILITMIVCLLSADTLNYHYEGINSVPRM